MATTTSKSKAKTKTTKKKPAAKAAAKTTKASKKTTAVKTRKAAAKASRPVKVSSKPAAAKVSRSSVSGRFDFLRRGQMAVAAVYALLAVAAGFLMNTNSAQVLLGHLAKDELASRSGTVLAPAAHVLYEIEFRWLLVVLLAIGAVIAVLRATRYYAREQAGLKSGVQPLRWVEFAIMGALAFEVAALLNGLQDAAALKVSMASVVIAALLAWVFEREHAVTGKPSRAVYTASALAVVVPVLALLVTIYGTYVYGMERSPWYAYAAAAVVSLSLLVTVRSVWNNFKNGKHSDYVRVNRNFNRISVGTKVLLAVVLIVGLYAK